MRHLVLLSLLFATLACGRAKRDRAQNEATLHMQLATMRKAIAAFTKTHGHGPPNLRVAMPIVPVDPLTHSATTWLLTTEENVQLDDFTTSSATAQHVAIVDVHSGAGGRDGNERPYSQY